MSEETYGNGRQDRYSRGNKNKFRNTNKNRYHGRGNRSSNNYHNQGRSNGGGGNYDNGESNWTPNQHNRKSRFPKFRDANQHYSGTRNMRDYERNQTNNYNQSEQQNISAIHQAPIMNTEMTESTSMKQTIVNDLSTENAKMSQSTASNLNETALTELRKEDNLPLRFPMETIESQLPKIKIEKVEEVKSQSGHKSSSSSSSNSDEEAEVPKHASLKQKTTRGDDKKDIAKIKTEHKTKKSTEVLSKPKVAKESSSEEEEESSETATSSSEEETPPKKIVNNKAKKSKKTKSERKQNSDEDVMCLGKVNNKFYLDDEEPQSDTASSKSKKTNDNCVLCDKQGHTSLECQMICKNCSKPYHNLKNCPQPPKLTVMMQSFMEFLMQQMTKFNPQAGSFEQHLRTSGISFESPTLPQPVVPGSPAVSSIHGKRKRSQIAAKTLDYTTKKPAKKRKHQKINKKDTDSDDASSASQSESESSSDSSEVASATYERKGTKIPKTETAFVSPFPGQLAMPGYSTLPAYGAGTAFNPMLPMLSQMMQNGYPVHGAFNFKQ